MTVHELQVILANIANKGKAHYPVEMMVIKNGMTFAQPITVELAQEYDGERVWIYENGAAKDPEWLHS